MNESKPNFNEIESEANPTLEEVYALIREYSSEEFTETRKLEDEKGVYLLEIEVPGKIDGEVYEYSYMRKGHYDGKGITQTEVHITLYEEGVPVTGQLVSRFVDGKWEDKLSTKWNDPIYE